MGNLFSIMTHSITVGVVQWNFPELSNIIARTKSRWGYLSPSFTFERLFLFIQTTETYSTGLLNKVQFIGFVYNSKLCIMDYQKWLPS